MLNDRPYPAPRKAKRSAVEIEEERAWVRFYRQVGQADIAAEVLAQLDADAQARHDHLALYLSCRESLRAHKARTQRNKRIGQLVRQAGRVLVVEPMRALRLKTSRAIDLLVATLRGAWPFRVTEPERERARKALARVGGEKLIDKPIAGLSGGETQRVFLARALINDPVLLILDEPTAGVDTKGRAEFMDVLSEISRSDELAAILVTHNLAAIARTAT